MKWGKTIVKILQAAAIAAGTMLVGAFLQGLQNYHPEPGTQAILWQAGGAALIGLVTGLFNWLKHKDEEIKN